MVRALSVLFAVSMVAALVFVSAAPLAGSSEEGRSGKTLFRFESFVGVSGAFVGSSMPLRGINGGGLPWVIDEGSAKLSANGKLEVEVEGLVIDPAANSAVAGTNPIPFFFATVSCLSTSGAVITINTATVHATKSGDAEITQVITLPASCIAPIVLIRGSRDGSPSGPWFAASGF